MIKSLKFSHYFNYLDVNYLALQPNEKPARAAPLVYALSALITVLGSYWFLTRVLYA